MTDLEKLKHAIDAWAAIRSQAHADALDTVVRDVCGELEALRLQLEHKIAATVAADDTINALRLQLRSTAAPVVISALSDLCTAYRALGGLDHAWDQVLVRGEQVLSSQPGAQPTDEQIIEAVRDECADFRWPSSAIKIARAVPALRPVAQPLTPAQVTALTPVQGECADTVMALIEDYAKAVHSGEDGACVVLQRTIRASLEQPPLTLLQQNPDCADCKTAEGW